MRELYIRIAPVNKDKCAARIPASKLRIGEKLMLPVTAEETEEMPQKKALCEIVKINRRKRWFLCEYAAGGHGTVLREAFCYVPEETDGDRQG